jgi:PAS domain S-box-containing protein
MLRSVVNAALFVLAALLFWLIVPSPAGAQGRRLVVTLYPQGSNAAAGNMLVQRGIRSIFAAQSAEQVDVYDEYLELAGVAPNDLLKLQVEFLRRKYAGRKVDLVITWVSPALDFALEHRPEIFPGVPIVFSTIEEREIKSRKLPPDVIGVPIALDQKGTLDLALRLHPKTRHVFVIAGTNKFDRYWESQAREEFHPYESEREFVYLSGLKLNELKERVAHLPDASLIYYVCVLQDGSGAARVPADVVEQLASVTTAPIYGFSDSFIGRGLVGGLVVSSEKEARAAAELGLRVFAGEKAEQIGVQPTSRSIPIFDWRQMKRWGIAEASLPAGSEVRYKELSLWDAYKWQIMGVLGVCAVETVLIGALLILLMSRKRATSALRESEERFRRMADTAPVLIWMSGPDKRCTYFNKPWLDFTGCPLQQQLGDGWSKGVHADDLAQCLKSYGEAFDARQSFRMQYRLRRFDGEYRWLVDIGVPRLGADGTFQGYIGSCIDITDQRLVEDTIRENHRELRLLSGRLIQAQEMERRRIARELHDDLSQSLALLSVKIDMLRQARPESTGKAGTSIDDLSTQVKQLSSSVHNLSHQLHPLKLEQLGLVAAIRSLCTELSHGHQIEIDFAHDETPVALSGDGASCLYRIVQESVRNVIRHSGARKTEVRLETTLEAICLRIIDDGSGFDPGTASRKGGLGLVSMRERLQLVGGTLTIDSRPSAGTRVDVRIPLSTAPAEAAGRVP